MRGVGRGKMQERSGRRGRGTAAKKVPQLLSYEILAREPQALK